MEKMKLDDLQTLSFEVTEEDIHNGREAIDGLAPRSTVCPIAQAARRYFPKALTVHVGKGIGTVVERRKTVYLYLPQEASNFIAAFDDNLPVRPFTCTMKVRALEN